MIENIIKFAELNPFTIGLTALSLMVFIIVIFLLNGRKTFTKNAKLKGTVANIFMIFIIMTIICYILVIGLAPSFAILIDQGDFAVLIYWASIFFLWGIVEYMTGIDFEKVFDDILG